MPLIHPASVLERFQSSIKFSSKAAKVPEPCIIPICAVTNVAIRGIVEPAGFPGIKSLVKDWGTLTES